MRVKSEKDIDGLKRVGKVVAITLKKMAQWVRPGVTTRELDIIGENILLHYGAKAAPKLVYGFPGATCISVNDEVAHGLPGTRILQEGDLVNIDVSAELDGYFADTGATIPVGRVSPVVLSLCNCSKNALSKAILAAKPGVRINEIGKLIEKEARDRGFNVIKNVGGHGIGKSLHEEPRKILNYYSPLKRTVLQEGTVIALETFISTGEKYLHKAQDGWTLQTKGKGLVAQYEHTIIVGQEGPIIVTQ